MARTGKNDDIEKMTFEQAIQQLKGIVDRIEQGEIPLQDSLEQYEKGMALIKHCRDILQKAEQRIEKNLQRGAARAPERTERLRALAGRIADSLLVTFPVIGENDPTE